MTVQNFAACYLNLNATDGAWYPLRILWLKYWKAENAEIGVWRASDFNTDAILLLRYK
jgi:hypothetical protein